jgi:predicted cupin superfamily sugar epimerase
MFSQTVIPGFEYSDHDFLTREGLEELVTEEQARELAWLVRKGPPPKEEELL